ncbi:MAG: HYR domain-containing protein, partial [Acidobacteria bacterium]|nr:HYR domain-containing protein [Acidobacteriota bacterium]
YSVALSNDTVIVGAPVDDGIKGSAYIFERNKGGADNWGEVKKLTASDGAAFDDFGWSVAISGSMVIVGAPVDDSRKGSSYIFICETNTPPMITCPGNITVSNEPGQCLASVSFTVTGTGTPTPTITCRIGALVITSPYSFPVGTTTVTCTASNGTLPDATCSFMVTVLDTQAPTVTVPSSVTMPAAAGICAATVTFSATAADNCSGASVSCVPASNTSFNVGTTTVSCKATDGAGNMSAAKTFTVTVTDTQAPTVTVPSSITMPAAAGTCAATVTFSATAADNCSGATVSCVPASNTSFPVGTTTVSCKATDGAGNMSAASTFTVTVTDTQAPTITCPANQSAASPSGNPIAVTYPAPTATDNCGTPTVTCVPASNTSFNVGTTTISCKAMDAAGNMSATCSFTVTVTATAAFTPTPTMSLVDPLACNGSGDLVNGSVGVANTTATAQTGTVTTALPAGIIGIPGTCVSNIATCTVTATTVSWSGTIPANQTLTLSYQAQLANDIMTGQILCARTTAVFGGNTGSIDACLTVNCPATGPGLPHGPLSQISDQKPGSILIYPVYTSDAANGAAQNARLNITNIHSSRGANIHLFFVDGSSCSVADSYICLTPNQTASVLASDIDPGTTGYLIAIATDRAGCPINFNYLIGDEFVKFASGHMTNLGAEAVAALAGSLPACNANSSAATINFNGLDYNLLPRVIASSNLQARADNNDTLLIVDRIGGSLVSGAATINGLFGLLYDDAEKGVSFQIAATRCQYRASLNNELRTTPRYETIIPGGRTGWMKLWSFIDAPIIGVQINRNTNAASNAGAFNQGHNLHKLTLTNTGNVTIPIFPPGC